VENRYLRLLAVAVLCFSRSGWTTGPEVQSFKGEVHAESPAMIHGAVTLTDLQNRPFGTEDIKGDGTFEFHNVPCGEYHLTVLDNGDQPIHDEIVSVRQPNQNLIVQVPLRAAGHARPGTVSVAQLLHPPARKAVEAFQAARKLSEAGNYAHAAEQLEKAVRISPEYADAWINLSAQHLRLGQYRQALDELSRAAGIAKPNAVLLSNMACAQHGLHRDQEAVLSAREALRLDKSYAPAHLLLGSILAADRRTLTEALAHLEIAVRVYPAVQGFLQTVRGEISEIVSHP